MYLFDKDLLQFYYMFRKDFALKRDLTIHNTPGSAVSGSVQRKMNKKGYTEAGIQNDNIVGCELFEQTDKGTFKLNIPAWEEYDSRFVDNLFNSKWEVEYVNLINEKKDNDAIRLTITPEDGIVVEFLLYIDMGNPELVSAVLVGGVEEEKKEIEPIIRLKRSTCGLPEPDETVSLIICAMFKPLANRYIEKVKETITGTSVESDIVEQMLNQRNMHWRKLMGV